jgi:hypothetical protein
MRDKFYVIKPTAPKSAYWFKGESHLLVGRNMRRILKNLRERNIPEWKIIRASDGKMLAERRAA